MPIHDFRCRDCGVVSEIFVHSADNHAARCSGCRSGNMEKLMSASYLIRTDVSKPDATCCGSTERCDSPPCSAGDICRRG
ncbi:FmdB family zinc ribbon protein [Chloroflexota bacterium]